jgi:hypothetical protein
VEQIQKRRRDIAEHTAELASAVKRAKLEWERLNGFV